MIKNNGPIKILDDIHEKNHIYLEVGTEDASGTSLGHQDHL